MALCIDINEASAPTTTHQTGETEMRIRDIIGDIIAVIALFGIGYGALLIGHGLGLQ
jgi:hypothetical protein